MDDDTGTSERLGDNIWKAAMLIALSNHPDLLIEESDMNEAIEKVLETFENLNRLLMSGTAGPANDKNVKSIVMRTTVALLLETDPLFEIERKKILRKGVGIFGTSDLDECIEHLLQAGMVKIDKRGGGIYYKLTDLVIKKHRDMKGKE